VATYFRDLATICDDFPLYRLKTAQDLAHLDRWMSTPLEQYLNGLTSDARLQAVLKAQSFLYGVDSRRAPLALHALVGLRVAEPVDREGQGAVFRLDDVNLESNKLAHGIHGSDDGGLTWQPSMEVTLRRVG